jgi:hypothetical protein
MKNSPNRKIVRAAIRGSVPGGKLKQAKIRLMDTRQGEHGIGGRTVFGNDRKTVTEILSPAADDAFGITVRGHETRHATKHTLGRKKPMTENAMFAMQHVDDVNVETMKLPSISGDGLEEYRRAHLAVAVKDLRGIVNEVRAIKAGTRKDSWQDRNRRLVNALRTKAMLAHYRGVYDREVVSPKTKRQSVAASIKLRKVMGDNLTLALDNIIKLARSSRGRNRAISMLTLLMESAPEDETREDDEPRGGMDSEILSRADFGTDLEGEFKIVDLKPKSAFNSREKQITQKYAPDGVHLNASRYVPAIVSGDSHGLFSRRVKHKPGGTVVIDASGSMGATIENLSQLAKLVPTSTIAYYSGNDHAKGQLTIYADKGMRYAGELPEESVKGGNSVDLAAVRWLFAHPKPWTLISDLQFTGGVIGSEEVAHALVDRAVERGELTVYDSFDAAFEAYGGKGELGDMKRKRLKLREIISSLRT